MSNYEKDWRRLEKTGTPYLNLYDVKQIYIILNNGKHANVGFFMKKAKNIASRSENNSYIFKDEVALFKLYQEFFSQQLKNKKISCFGELMQYIA